MAVDPLDVAANVGSAAPSVLVASGGNVGATIVRVGTGVFVGAASAV